jgi:hypothetical protein
VEYSVRLAPTLRILNLHPRVEFILTGMVCTVCFCLVDLRTVRARHWSLGILLVVEGAVVYLTEPYL